MPEGSGGFLVIDAPMASNAATVYGDPDRYVKKLLVADPGHVLHGRRRAQR